MPLETEIKASASALHSLKTPGLDGFLDIFYLYYWETMKQQVTSYVQESFRTRDISKSLNKSFIVLIPKTQHAMEFKNFCPIGLCNFKYKIISKIITLRVKNLLPKMIAPNQGAFVEGRWIADSTVLAQELVQKVKKFKRKGGLMLAKIDLTKAYNRFEWLFINVVQEA